MKDNTEYEYIDNLIENCQKAKIAKPLDKKTINIKEIHKVDKETIDKNFDDIKNINAIYIFKEIKGNKEKTFDLFSEYKGLNERKCPKENKPSDILYVGSSTTSLKKRIKEHVGFGSVSTYALQLRYWFKGECEITILFYNEEKEVIQIIEDNISNNLKPAFGKMGGNNK